MSTIKQLVIFTMTSMSSESKKSIRVTLGVKGFPNFWAMFLLFSKLYKLFQKHLFFQRQTIDSSLRVGYIVLIV